MAKIVSLSTVSLTINNPNYEQIVVGGNGHLVGQVTMSRGNAAFTMQGSPDGGYVVGYTKNRTGSFNIQISQSSSLIARLTKFINWCEANPNLAESTITVTDLLGNIQGYGSGVFPDKIPDNTVSESVGSRTFNFLAGVVTFEEGDE